MDDEQIKLHFQIIQQQIAALQGKETKTWEEIDAALEDLHVIYEQMQTSLEAARIIEEELLQQNQSLVERYNHYYDLFQSLPIAYFVTDANGVILEANQSSAQLLNVPQRYLAGKPLAIYVLKDDWLDLHLKFSKLASSRSPQVWQTNICPREREPLAVELHIKPIRDEFGSIQELRIGVYNIGQFQQRVAQFIQPQNLEGIRAEEPISIARLPQSLDGLRVLIVDDEADVREFITAVLASHGIGVKAVASATAALEAVQQFRPDVLLSDIRMPNEDGYRLIRQIRALEARQGGHIPAAAITAYVDENREKALEAGYEAYLHKLAHPDELIEMVAQLARQASTIDRDSLN